MHVGKRKGPAFFKNVGTHLEQSAATGLEPENSRPPVRVRPVVRRPSDRIQPDQPRLLLLMIRPARPTLAGGPLADLFLARRHDLRMLIVGIDVSGTVSIALHPPRRSTAERAG